MYWATFLALPSQINGKLLEVGLEELGHAKKVLGKFGAGPIDQTFVAAPASVSEAVLQTQGVLLDWPTNVYSEPGRIVFPLKPEEGGRLEKLVNEVDMNSGGLADLGVGTDARQFVIQYGAARWEQYKEYGSNVRHSLTIGYPLLLQAIALAFPLCADGRARLERLVIHPGTIFQICVRLGTILTEDDVKTGRLLVQPFKKAEEFTAWPRG